LERGTIGQEEKATGGCTRIPKTTANRIGGEKKAGRGKKAKREKSAKEACGLNNTVKWKNKQMGKGERSLLTNGKKTKKGVL